MSKKCMMRRETKRKDLVKRYTAKRKQLRNIIDDPNVKLKEKEVAQEKIQKLPIDSSYVRLRNRCWMTGRGNGVYRIVGLCRNKFREHAMNGDIPGITKASW